MTEDVRFRRAPLILSTWARCAQRQAERARRLRVELGVPLAASDVLRRGARLPAAVRRALDDGHGG